MNLVWSKLAVILACTMAGESDLRMWEVSGFNLSAWGIPVTPAAPPSSHHDENVCASSCASVNLGVSLWHAVAPLSIGVCVWFVASLPTMLMRSQHRTRGVRACLWQLLLLWLNLILAYALFCRQRVWGYVWAIHSAAHTLTAWAPSRRVLLMPLCHRWLMVAGVAAVCAFAWQMGPSVGLISLRSGWQSQCGLSAHLMAVLGVDVMGWVLGPIGSVVAGVDKWSI
jgi:hypothetical protein